jgi:hypothetical protein
MKTSIKINRGDGVIILREDGGYEILLPANHNNMTDPASEVTQNTVITASLFTNSNQDIWEELELRFLNELEDEAREETRSDNVLEFKLKPNGEDNSDAPDVRGYMVDLDEGDNDDD